ncbi:MAG: acyl-CoA thioesterase [Aquincola sp.]|uniref:acyl-CoA thioesterase n=1 Tax=uncultured Aquincola sp. TaxID=886556 RepID=UPI0032B0FF70|nr:acyl-CoA thioesterase [Aquincola sp.]
MRFDLPDDKRLVHTLVIPVRWGDMDAAGHVNNAMYFRYFETVRLDWLQQARGGAELYADGTGPVLVNAFCNFLRQLRFPADVVARHYVGRAGRSSIETFLTLERTDEPGQPYATGGGKLVWTDVSTEKSIPLPDWLRALAVG